MIRGLVIRDADEGDAEAIRELLDAAFETDDESRLVENLRADGDRVLELVAVHEGELVGEIFFSRLQVVSDEGHFDALALGPLAVLPGWQRTGIGRALIEHAHPVLTARGELLSVVLGEPAYYGRFGYSHDRAAGFESKYQSPYLQALAWGEAPAHGRLRYPAAFAGL
jgi:putative acetyltransferase